MSKSPDGVSSISWSNPVQHPSTRGLHVSFDHFCRYLRSNNIILNRNDREPVLSEAATTALTRVGREAVGAEEGHFERTVVCLYRYCT